MVIFIAGPEETGTSGFNGNESWLTCLLVTLVLAGVQEAASTQLVEPGPTGVLLVVQQDLGRVQPV